MPLSWECKQVETGRPGKEEPLCHDDSFSFLHLSCHANINIYIYIYNLPVTTVEGRNPAPPKKPWNDDSPVTINKRYGFNRGFIS